MRSIAEPRERLFAAGTLVTAAACGVLLARADARALLLLAALTLGAFAIVAFEAPVVAFAVLALTLGAASEDVGDDALLGIRDVVYGKLASIFNLPLLIVALLAIVIGLALQTQARRWPGLPATAAAGLLVVAAATLALKGQLGEGLFMFRPLIMLVLAILVGYWISLRYGPRLPLTTLVATAAIAIPIGMYNVSTGELSYYDSSVVYLLGLSFVLVLFRAVEIGYARVPFLVLSMLVIVLSLRRGAMIGIAITLLITGVIAGRGTFRAVVALLTGTVLALELVSPGFVLAHVEQVVGYFTGASGQDFAVNYRRYETTNAWLNVQQNWMWGIGPREWTLYRTFDGAFDPINRDYVHNSYLWVWLRYGILGLIAFGVFLAVSALTLLRRSAPVVAIAVGASIVGLAATLVTASFLTTTSRWPLTIGLFLGIALASIRATPQGRGSEAGWLRASD